MEFFARETLLTSNHWQWPCLLSRYLLHTLTVSSGSSERSELCGYLALDWPAIWCFKSFLFSKFLCALNLLNSAVARSSTSLELLSGSWKKYTQYLSPLGASFTFIPKGELSIALEDKCFFFLLQK